MIREIIKDTLFLGQKSEPSTREDIAIAQALLDTLAAHADHCVGLAANIIGVKKCIIAVNVGPVSIAMLNPVITKKSAKSYETTEGCLSLTGERPTTRYASIEVTFRDLSFKKQKQKFTGFTAEIIQHEIDHCQGILI